MSFRGTCNDINLMDKNYTIKVIASDGLKTAEQEFKINFENKVPTMKKNVKSFEEQFLAIKVKPQVG